VTRKLSVSFVLRFRAATLDVDFDVAERLPERLDAIGLTLILVISGERCGLAH
jgi:hypothetical protein